MGHLQELCLNKWTDCTSWQVQHLACLF
jgi:hypothetical protein